MSNLSEVEVLVYSGGKTGSMTLFHTFKEYFGNSASLKLKYIHKSIHLGRGTISQLIKTQREKKLTIISVYREPMSRHISALFENYKIRLKKLFDGEKDISDHYFENKIKNMLVVGYETNHPHQDLLSLKDEINVFNIPFDHQKGYQVYECDQFKWIYVRFDHMNQIETIIRENTEYKTIVLKSVNLSSQKSYWKDYNKHNHPSLPRKLLDLCFERDRDDLNYFYTPKEIQTLKNQWYSHSNEEDVDLDIERNRMFLHNDQAIKQA